MGNNPVNFSDPSGHERQRNNPCRGAGSGFQCHRQRRLAQEAENIRLDKEAKKLGYADLLSYQDTMKKTGKALETLLDSQRNGPPPPICFGPRWGNGDCVDIRQLVDDLFTSIGLDSATEVLTGELKIGWNPSLVTWEEVGLDVLGIAGDLIPVTEFPATWAEGVTAFKWSVTGVETYTDIWSVAQGKPDYINGVANWVSVIPGPFGFTASVFGLGYNLSKGFYLY